MWSAGSRNITLAVSDRVRSRELPIVRSFVSGDSTDSDCDRTRLCEAGKREMKEVAST